MDHAATTAVDPRVVEAMLPYFTATYGNASSIHSWGREACEAMEDARQTVADILCVAPKEVVFTSCGTESDNLAVRGVALVKREKGNHIITSSIEHHAVGHTCEQLEREFGFEVTYLDVDCFGRVLPEAVEESLKRETVLVTLMLANNETGTLNPIAKIAEIVKDKGIIFHSDAVQAIGKIPVRLDDLGVDRSRVFVNVE